MIMIPYMMKVYKFKKDKKDLVPAVCPWIKQEDYKP